MPVRQLAEPKISDSKTDKMFDAVPNGFKHPVNLPIDSLSQHNAQTCRRDGVKSRNFCPLAIEKNSAQQFRRERWIPRPIHRHLIFLLDLVTWVGKPLRQVAIICEKKQTFSLRVQAPNIEETRKLLRKQIKDSIASVLIFSGRNEAGGFMQYDGECPSGEDKFAIDFDVIARARLCAEVCADFTVDGDATRRNELVAMATRTDPSGSKEAIETQSGVTKVNRVTSLQRTARFSFVTFVTLLTVHFRAERVTHPASFSAGQ
jgi:hypothetical protein